MANEKNTHLRNHKTTNIEQIPNHLNDDFHTSFNESLDINDLPYEKIEITQNETMAFKKIILSFFDQTTQKIIIKSKPKDNLYTAIFSRKEIFLDLKGDDHDHYHYSLHDGKLQDYKTLTPIPNKRALFYGLIQKVCADIDDKKAIIEVKKC